MGDITLHMVRKELQPGASLHPLARSVVGEFLDALIEVRLAIYDAETWQEVETIMQYAEYLSRQLAAVSDEAGKQLNKLQQQEGV